MTNIDDVPDEILGMIFGISLAYQRSVLGPFTPSSSRSYVTPRLGYHNCADVPFVFLQVSRRWRYIAKSSPALWASLSACQYGHVASTGVPLAALRYWLSLSGSLPLHFYMDTPLNYKTGRRRLDESTARHSQKLMAILAREFHLSRWKSISVVLTPALCAQLTETLIHKYTTLHSPVGLERIEVELRDRLSPTRLLYAISLIPSLRELFWRSLFPSRFITFIELLPLGQLSRIFIHMPISIHEAGMFLAKCKTVTHVTLKGIHTCGQGTTPSIVTLPKLAELALSGTQNVLAVLNHIRCPALDYLNIDNRMSRPVPESWISLDAFFIRSKAEVNSVIIRHSAKLPAVDLAGFLRIGQQFGIPYYMVTCRGAHATSPAILGHEHGLEPFTRYVRIPGGAEYVGMDRLAHNDKHFGHIRLREVSTSSLKREMILCAGVRVRLSTYLISPLYTPVSSTPLHILI